MGARGLFILQDVREDVLEERKNFEEVRTVDADPPRQSRTPWLAGSAPVAQGTSSMNAKMKK